MRLKTSVLLLLFASITLIGCASGLPGMRPLTYASPGETRIFLSNKQCPHETVGPEIGAIMTAVLSAAASQALTNFGNSLQKASEGGALPSSASYRNFTPEPGDVPTCIVLIRGSFAKGSEFKNKLEQKQLWGSDPGLGPKEFNERIDALGLSDVYRVDHLIELRLVVAPSGNALTFAPIFATIQRSIDGSTDGSRDLSVALKFESFGGTATGGTVLLADRTIGDWPDATMQYSGSFPVEAPWFAVFNPKTENTTAPASGVTGAVNKTPASPAKPSSVVGGGGSGMNSGDQAEPKTAAVIFSKKGSSLPVTVYATVVETRPSKEGLAFIASVFGAVKPKLEEEVKNAIDPTTKQAADEVEKIASIEARANFDDAVTGAKVALLAYCGATANISTDAGKTDVLNKSAAARIAQQRANVAALKADVSPLPFPPSKLVIISDAKPTDNAGCGT